MRNKFKMIRAISAVGFVAALMAAPFCGIVYAQNADPGGVVPADVAAFGQQNRGVVLCTASINSDGSVAGGFGVDKTVATRGGVGFYRVQFKAPCGGNIQVNRGWARWVQVDTLTFGTNNGYCTTADLASTLGVGGVFVNCLGPGGTNQDTSFNLFVAR